MSQNFASKYFEESVSKKINTESYIPRLTLETARGIEMVEAEYINQCWHIKNLKNVVIKEDTIHIEFNGARLKSFL
jgi:hypothetical protein